MDKVTLDKFSDEFMELHAEYVQLCKDFTKGKADMIFVYISMERYSSQFHCYFLVDGKIVTADPIGEFDEVADLFDVGSDNIMLFRETCKNIICRALQRLRCFTM